MISRLKILEMENIKLKEDKLSKHLEQRGTEDEVSTVEKVCMYFNYRLLLEVCEFLKFEILAVYKF